MRRAQGFLDRVCGVENRVLLGERKAGFGAALIQLHSPFPARWIGHLDDLILDTPVFHQGHLAEGSRHHDVLNLTLDFDSDISAPFGAGPKYGTQPLVPSGSRPSAR